MVVEERYVGKLEGSARYDAASPRRSLGDDERVEKEFLDELFVVEMRTSHLDQCAELDPNEMEEVLFGPRLENDMRYVARGSVVETVSSVVEGIGVGRRHHCVVESRGRCERGVIVQLHIYPLEVFAFKVYLILHEVRHKALSEPLWLFLVG